MQRKILVQEIIFLLSTYWKMSLVTYFNSWCWRQWSLCLTHKGEMSAPRPYVTDPFQSISSTPNRSQLLQLFPPFFSFRCVKVDWQLLMRSHWNTPFKVHEFAFVPHGRCWCILAHWHWRMRICEQMKLSIYKMAKSKSVPRYFFLYVLLQYVF